MLLTHEQLLHGLKATAEPSRLRLLAVLAIGEFTVSELTQLLGQSQPRVSRHLRLLAEGGLLERFREQHWVYHRLPGDGPGAALARALLALLDADDPQAAIDRERATAILASRAAGEDGPGDDAETRTELATAVARELGEGGRDSLAYAGPAPAEMLAALGSRARRAIGVSGARHEVQRARARLHGRGYAHCVLKHGDLSTVAVPVASHDVVVLDRMLGDASARAAQLSAAARVLAPGGTLVVIEDYDALVQATPAANPLAALRGWIADAGLACARLRPVDAGHAHVLVAVATAPGAERAA
jgi:DNA-binding transcriptional ArsR family regulator